MNSLKLVQNLLITSLVVMAGLAVLATPASAQTQPSFSLGTVTGPSAPLKVDLDSYPFEVPWNYNYNNAALTAGGNVQTSATLTWGNVECNKAGVQVLGTFSEIVNVQPTAGQNQVSSKSKFTLKVTEEAPGETPITCTMKAHMGAVGSFQATGDSPTTFSVTAAYRGILSTSLESTIGEAGPQAPITYVLKVDNLGNSDSSVAITQVENKAAADAGWQPVIPGAFQLESAKKGGTATSKSVNIQISTPHKNGWNNQETTFQFDITPTSVKDTTNVGQKYSVTMLARVRGVYVPGPEPMLLALAVLGTALVARRLRDE